MADTGGSSNGGGSIANTYIVPAWLALMALIGSFAWPYTPLNSLRPDGTPHRPGDIYREQSVEARMWQDPIAAIEKARAPQSPSSPANTLTAPAPVLLSSEEMGQAAQTHANDFKPSLEGVPGLRVVLAMVPSSMYAEEAEARLRMRQAVVSALAAAGYRASDEERIGAWKVAWPLKLAAIDPENIVAPPDICTYPPFEKTDVFFPFERFEMRRNITRVHKGPDDVMVVWLPDNLFDKEPIARLAQLVQVIRHWNVQPKVDIDILGPVGSSMLRNALPWRENPSSPLAVDTFKSGAADCLKDVRMFSWSASASDGLLVRHWESGENRGTVKKYLLRAWGLDFINTTATDDQLSAELIDELALRGVDLSKERDQAVLLYEWDTFYGRTLPLSFAANVYRRQHPEKSTSDLQASSEALETVLTTPERAGRVSGAVTNLHAYTYLRGIDGKLPKDAERKDTLPGADAPSKQEKETAKELNRSEGPNQLDYIPRVAMAIRSLTADLDRGSLGQKGTLKAIGLMGSDFYDKLLLLQALQPHFPDAIFFTTDLDARFLDPQFARWTRNLVVASPFGQTLGRELQRDAPPFRGSYQTAVFYAMLGSLGTVNEKQLSHAPAVRRFEVGRLQAEDFSITPDPAGIQPKFDRTVSVLGIFCWVVLTFIGAWLAIIFWPSFRNVVKPFDRNYARRRAILFTGNDVLHPDEVQAELELGKEPGKSPTTMSRQKVARALNELLLASSFNYSKALKNQVETLTGQDAPGTFRPRRIFPVWSRAEYDRDLAATKKLAERRLELETMFAGNVAGCQERCRVLNARLRGVFLGAGLIVAAMAVFAVCIVRSHTDPAGEPFSLFDGISAWPCESFRLIAFILTLVFASIAHHHLREDEARLSEQFFLARSRQLRFLRFFSRWRLGRAPGLFNLPRLRTVLSYCWAIRERYPAIGWRSLHQKVSAERLWRDYRDRSRLLPRLLRSGAHLILYLVFCVMIVLLADRAAFVPARGHIVRTLDSILLPATVISFLYLNFLVADAVRLARTFILLLAKGPTVWPKIARREGCSNNESAKLPKEWLDVQFIGELTKKIACLVYYPAVILALLIVARTRYFDDWSWPPALIVIFTLNSFWPILSAFLLQSAAKQARDEALASLRKKCDLASEDKRTYLHGYVDRIIATREGAFANYLDNPALKALLVPFTGAGVMNLVNFLGSS